MWANGMNWKHLSDQKNKIWVWTAVDHFPKGILEKMDAQVIEFNGEGNPVHVLKEYIKNQEKPSF
jgi:hypothetical protein